ncbi:transcription elongation factor GreA [candidate division WWE3 bacterium RIFOXYC1_FULL_39_7]|uniref:Transcription elongation factor GreA n=2 Tax=Katanobacteria TaxID=422282 RepID=A0A1F4X712_UNCKA|nr:MAG: transcription elongation factor GreA [candidate division WWE3 bacterium RIFOXYC1_FULL_39_7]OGC77442.1 MAG: transcription elongation factor GreA [candidate division WWE3 bacterium RIFOXYD1_FULL_39_9]
MQKNEILYVTKEGLAKLKNELKELIEEKRPEVARRIQNAREMGDISENAEYDAARQEQSYIEGRIAELEEVVKSSKVSDAQKSDGVGIGSKVTVHIEGDEETFHIVGAPEANPSEKKISHESPLGVALFGKKVGDLVEVEAPVGKLTYTIINIEQ